MIRNVKLSLAQERLWFLDQVLLKKSLFNITSIISINGKLSIEHLQKAFQDLIVRHEILRMQINESDGAPIGQILDGNYFEIELTDFNCIGNKNEELKKYIQYKADKEFNLLNSPLMRTELIKLEDEAFVLIITLHHIITDEWSTDILFRDLSAFYRAKQLNVEPELPKLAIQYFDYADWQRSIPINKELLYWSNYLKNAPDVLPMPTDKVRPVDLSYQGASYKTHVSNDSLIAIKKYCQKTQITLFTYLISVFQLLLHRLTGEEDIVIGYPSANRVEPGIEELIGFFVNVLPLRSRLNRGQEFHSFLTETRNQLFQGYKNQNIHFDQLVTSLKVKRNQNIHPIFQALFTIHTSYHEELDFNGLKIKFLEIEDNLAKFDLSLFCSENSNELTIKLVYAKDLYNESTIKIIAECYQHLLTQLLRDENILIENISLDTHQSSIQLNNFKTDDKESTLHALFARQVLLNPEKTASIWKEKEYSYREINDFANQFANYLQAKGIKPGEVIVTLLEPGAEIISCILGILKIGCVYLPIDFKYPEARILAIIRDAKPQLLIANQSNFFEKIASEVSLINLDVDARIIHQESKIFSADIRNQDNACIIYTSGSTGTPKGVICKHSSLINRIQWYWRTYPSKSDETCIFLANVSFVDSLGEIFAPLLHGVKLIIAPAQTPADPELLITYLTKYAVTRVCVVPSLLRILLENYPTLALVSTKLKHWEISGEEFPKDLILKTLRMLNNVRLINRYGSTEATSIIYNELTLDVNDTNQIIFKSQIIDNTVLLILDKNLVPLPNGLIGQLYVGGAPLANGYLNNPGLTNEKFINYESNNSFNGTIYKTGDSARLDQDGNIEIIGRLDRQIKINGFRVELGEIESVIEQFHSIKQCVVLAKQVDSNLKKLIAFLRVEILTDRDKFLSELLKYLANILPSYMIPSSFNILDNFKHMLNGKLDIEYLHAFKDEIPINNNFYVAPRNNTELKLTKIWENILKINQIGIYDDFFQIGGNSLVAIRMIAAIQKEFSIKYPVSNIFKYTTVAATAKALNTNSQLIDADVILPIQTKGTKSPLFLVHTALGLSFPYTILAYSLKEQPIYGINDPGLNDPAKAFHSIEAMAAFYIEVIQHIQPAGPYTLGGWSFGGMVALEMAQQLKEKNYEVKLVMLFDTTNYPKTSITDLSEKDLNEIFTDLGIERGSHEASLITQECTNTIIIRKQYSAKAYEGRAILIKAKDDEYTIPYRVEDPFQGWYEVFGRSLEIYSVAGLHHTIFNNNNIPAVVEILEKVIDNHSPKILQDNKLNLLDAYLHHAIEAKDEFLIKRFVECGANMDSIDSSGLSASAKKIIKSTIVEYA